MNLGQARTKLRRKIGNPSTVDVANALLTEALNESYRELATKYRHYKARKMCNFDTVEDQAEYGLPTDCGAIIQLWDITNEVEILRKYRKDFVLEDSPTSGKPTHYLRFRDYILLTPPPDDIYTLRLHYREDIADLSADGDEPVLPTPWHQGWVLQARWWYYDDQGDVPKALYALKMFERWLEGTPTEIDEENMHSDMGVVLPGLGSAAKRLDFDHED